MSAFDERELHRAGRVSASRLVVVYLILCGLWLTYSDGLLQAFGQDYPLFKLIRQYERWALVFISAVILYVLMARTQIRHQKSEFESTETTRAISTLIGNLPGMAYRSHNDFVRTMFFVSDGCVELTGYQANELINNRKVQFERMIHPDDQKKVSSAINDALEHNRRFRVEYRIRTKSGEEKWVLEQGCGTELVDGRYVILEGLLVDISRQKVYERQLEEHRAHLEEVVEVRTRDLTQANEQLRDEVEERKRLEQKLRDLSTRDALTGLFNRRVMDQFLHEEMERCTRYARPLSVVMIDLDHFKKLNDTYGHQSGDEVLRWMAGIVRASVRTCDRAVRYGGEEVALILPESDADAAWIVASRLRERLAAQPIDLKSESGEVTAVTVTMSVGLAAFPEDGRTAEALIAAADQALYKSKRQGRNRVTRASGLPPLKLDP